MTCILVHRRHSTKLVSLPLSLSICRYALSSCSVRSEHLDISAVGELPFDILIYVWHLYILSIICSYIIIFERCGYANYQLFGNGVIRSIYMLLTLFSFVIFWGTTSRPMGVAYHLYMLCLYLYCFYLWYWWTFLDWSLIVVAYTDMYMYYWRLGLAGSRHWSTYMYCMLVSYHSAPRPYIRTGWSVVRQTDGPCQFFCRNYNSILK